MIAELPMYVNFTFIITTFITIFLFLKAVRNPKIASIIIFTWLLLQTFIGFTSFYHTTYSIPPRFILFVFPPLTLMIVLFPTSSGKKFIDSLNIKYLTYIHTVRIPVEIVLYWLFLQNQIPQLMTFEG